MTDLTILATGSDLIEGEVRGTESATRELIVGAREEIHVLAYTISAEGMRIVNMLEEGLRRGVRVRLVVNKLHEKEGAVVDSLLVLNRRYARLGLGDFSDPGGRDLHAKVIVVDREAAIIGSANLSYRGMSGNYEIGVLIRDRSCWKLAEMIDGLAEKFKVGKRPDPA